MIRTISEITKNLQFINKKLPNESRSDPKQVPTFREGISNIKGTGTVDYNERFPILIDDQFLHIRKSDKCCQIIRFITMIVTLKGDMK